MFFKSPGKKRGKLVDLEVESLMMLISKGIRNTLEGHVVVVAATRRLTLHFYINGDPQSIASITGICPGLSIAYHQRSNCGQTFANAYMTVHIECL